MRRAVRVITPANNAVVIIPRILVVRLPGDDKATIIQGINGGMVLVMIGMGINQELATVGASIGIIALGIDALVRAVLVVGIPGNDIIAMLENRDVRMPLVARNIRIDLELAAVLASTGVITLGIDALIGAVTRLVVGLPGDDKTAVAEAGHRWLILRARGIRVEPELFADRRTRAGEQLAADIRPRAAVMTTAVLPGDHIAAVHKAGYRRISLIRRLPGIDLKLFRLARQRQLAIAEANLLDPA